MSKGWHRHSYEHALAARGVKWKFFEYKGTVPVEEENDEEFDRFQEELFELGYEDGGEYHFGNGYGELIVTDKKMSNDPKVINIFKRYNVVLTRSD